MVDEQNELLRSAYQIALREGKNTNWEAFRQNLKQKLLLNSGGDEHNSATCTARTFVNPKIGESTESDRIRFEVGRYYEHATGQRIHIVGSAKTTTYGWTLIAEQSGYTDLKAVGQSDDYAQNWKEITEADWLECFSGD